MFDHSHLPNIGLTNGEIPPQIYQALNQEIVDIHNDDSKIMRMNRSLAVRRYTERWRKKYGKTLRICLVPSLYSSCTL